MRAHSEGTRETHLEMAGLPLRHRSDYDSGRQVDLGEEEPSARIRATTQSTNGSASGHPGYRRDTERAAADRLHAILRREAAILGEERGSESDHVRQGRQVPHHSFREYSVHDAKR